ncbi:MAG: hypothetical protein IV100_02945 [Myxococcales bacterium]|nr:hypothetical protein [Myxococcales bacterium]
MMRTICNGGAALALVFALGCGGDESTGGATGLDVPTSPIDVATDTGGTTTPDTSADTQPDTTPSPDVQENRCPDHVADLCRSIPTALPDWTTCASDCTFDPKCTSGCVTLPSDCASCTEAFATCWADCATPCADAAGDDCVDCKTACTVALATCAGVTEETCCPLCDPATEECQTTAPFGCVKLPDCAPGDACDDGDACTMDDQCTDEGCRGTALSCPDDGIPCTTESCADGLCVSTPDDLACDDGDACTTDTCGEAGCVSSTPKDCDDGLPCTTDACDPATGSCVATVEPDHCVIDGACVASGTASPDNACQACLPALSTSAWSARPDDTPCAADDVACTADVCKSSVCMAIPDPALCADGIACTTDQCTEAGCENTPDLSACTDSDACTTDDCTAGGCTYGPRKACDDALACTSDTCDGATGECVATLAADYCLIEGACVAAGTPDPDNPCRTCQPAVATDAYSAVPDGQACEFDSVACTLDRCAAGTCAATPDDAACADDDLCTTDRCTAAGCTNTLAAATCLIDGICVAEGALQDGDPCRACLPAVSTTAWSVRPNGSACTSDDIPCTTDTCEAGACVHTPVDTACDDGDACTASDTCTAGGCVLAPRKPCDDGLPCTTDACNPLTGQCEAALTPGACVIAGACVDEGEDDPTTTCRACLPALSTSAFSARPDGTSCSADDVACTVDTCSGGACVATPNAAACSDDVACTTDACTPTGCTHTPVDAACSDGDACTTDACTLAGCTVGPRRACDDQIPCTTDSCNATTGACEASLAPGACLIGGTCVASNSPDPTSACRACQPALSTSAWTALTNGTACTADAVACTTDACQAGTCVATPNNAACDDGVACTINTCTGAGCTFTPVDAACSDSDACTSDACTPTGCTFGPRKACDDGLACTTDLCSATTGQCTATLQANACLIGGSCITAGALSPGSECQSCQPAVSTSVWSPRPNGTACTADAVACTAELCEGGACASKPNDVACVDDDLCTADRCTASGCENTLASETCLIDGVCVAAGASHPTDPCRACLPATSTTAWSTRPNGAPCTTDGVACTVDTCQAGACLHTPNDAACDDGDACTVGDACAAQGCVIAPRKVCDDGLPCTTDACNAATGNCAAPISTGSCVINGACIAEGTSDPASPCRACLPAFSTSAWSPRPNGTTCTADAIACTVDTCQAGACVATPKDAACTDGVACTTDACAASGCTNTPNPTACNDNDACTTGDTCTAAGCTFGPRKPCDDGLSCTTDACNASTGSCEATLLPNQCLIGGACVSAGTADPTSACRTCQPALSTSVYSARPNGSTCTADGLACTVDACDAGTCKATPNDAACSDGVACTIDACSGAGCTNTPNPTACNDNDACTTGDTCTPSGCTFGPRKPCDDGLACTADSCNAVTGSCTNALQPGVCVIGGVCVASGTADPESACRACQPPLGTSTFTSRPTGTACTADGLACTVDTCQAGVCTASPNDASCDDSVACTVDACTPNGCTNTPNPSACNDNDACTTGDTCTAAGCSFGPRKACDDGLACTTDSCNATSGACDAVTKSGSCVIAGACVSAGSVDPQNPCRSCAPATSTTAWTALPNGTACTADAVACTVDTCQAGTCTASPSDAACGDGVACTIDTCGATGCVNTPNSSTCNDNDACTTGDTCTSAGCSFGLRKPCNDGLPCTADACNAATGECEAPVSAGSCLIAGQCVAAGAEAPNNPCAACQPLLATTSYSPRPNGVPCTGDAVACTVDTCQSGTCVATADDAACSDGIACTDDLCTALGCLHPESAGTCFIGGECYADGGPLVGTDCVGCRSAISQSAASPLDGATCDDADVCTTGDACFAGVCGGSPLCPEGTTCNEFGECVETITSSDLIFAVGDLPLVASIDVKFLVPKAKVAGNAEIGVLPLKPDFQPPPLPSIASYDATRWEVTAQAVWPAGVAFDGPAPSLRLQVPLIDPAQPLTHAELTIVSKLVGIGEGCWNSTLLDHVRLETCEGELCTCVPMCAGKVCGDDGCGGTCGSGCSGGQLCQDGACGTFVNAVLTYSIPPRTRACEAMSSVDALQMDGGLYPATLVDAPTSTSFVRGPAIPTTGWTAAPVLNVPGQYGFLYYTTSPSKVVSVPGTAAVDVFSVRFKLKSGIPRAPTLPDFSRDLDQDFLQQLPSTPLDARFLVRMRLQ